MGARLMEVTGRVEMDDEVLHVIVSKMEDATWRLSELSDDLLETPVARADHVNTPLQGSAGPQSTVHIVPEAANADCAPRQHKRSLAAPQPTHPRNVRILPKSRDFH